MATRPTFVVTGKVRISYEHLTKPYANQPGAEEKYSATLLIPKSDVTTKQKIDAAIAAAIQEGVTGKWGGIQPAQPATPIHDGDGVRPTGDPYSAECKGHWVITASSKLPPEIVDINRQPILSATEIYSGMYARVSLNFFAYFNSGRKGIGCGLGNVQKIADGEPLGGRTSAADDFGDGFTDGQTQPAVQNAPPWASAAPAPSVNPLTGQPAYNPMAAPAPAINPLTGQPV